jgi:hypothetical protein
MLLIKKYFCHLIARAYVSGLTKAYNKELNQSWMRIQEVWIRKTEQPLPGGVSEKSEESAVLL